MTRYERRSPGSNALSLFEHLFLFFDVVSQLVRSTLLDFGPVWANDEISELSVFFEKIKLFDILFKFFDFQTDYFQNSIPIEN